MVALDPNYLSQPTADWFVSGNLGKDTDKVIFGEPAKVAQGQIADIIHSISSNIWKPARMQIWAIAASTRSTLWNRNSFSLR
jgi:hypothetical protein